MNPSYKQPPFDQADGERPKQEGTPSKVSDNAQLQWVLESITQLKASQESMHAQLKASHDALATNVEHKFDLLHAQNETKNVTLDTKLSSIDGKSQDRHKALEDKIENSHQLLISKIENSELRLNKTLSDTRIDSIKWIVGLVVGFPSVAWMIVQLFNNFSKT
ncbi:TPA: hypothetical protein ACSP31_000814 [Aeromonas veronii]